MGGTPPAPKDNSAEVARIEAQAAREAREAEALRKEEELAQFNARLQNAHSGAIDNALTYFSGRGVNADDYVDEITQKASSIRGSVPSLDASPGSYYDNLGQLVFEAEQEAQRARANREFNQFAPQNFAVKRISDTSDDAILEAILEERFAEADQYSRNLLDRGVINETGYAAALKDLEGQRAGARSRLSELGLGELERGRGQLRNIASEGRSAASNLLLDQPFDPYEYQRQIDTTTSDFFTGIGDRIRGATPDDIFTTSGLAGIAGATQGAQNLNFNPAAIAGTNEDENDEDENTDVVEENVF